MITSATGGGTQGGGCSSSGISVTQALDGPRAPGIAPGKSPHPSPDYCPPRSRLEADVQRYSPDVVPYGTVEAWYHSSSRRGRQFLNTGAAASAKSPRI